MGPKETNQQFVANGIQLSGREWLLVALVFASVIFFLPGLWKRVEGFAPGPDYRVPKALSEDYWLYDRWARHAAEAVDVLVVGDSVVWGEYVLPEGTLTQHLNRQAGKRRFANLGLAGMHPVPLAGLVEHYGTAIVGKSVILHCNPLWLSSPRHDLREEKEFHFNHPTLVPQFHPRIPCYQAETSVRIGFVVERHLPFSAWTRHLQIAYYDAQDIPSWTLDHPYENPVHAVTLEVAGPQKVLRHSSISWRERGIREQDLSWVDPDTSLQWSSFQRTVKILRQRGNRIAVLVGPFNEHMLTDVGRKAYARVKAAIVDWLRNNEIPFTAPDPLPDHLYADASHPLSEGYALLARGLLASDLLQEEDSP